MKTTTPTEPAYLTKSGAARYSSTSERALDYARQRGELPFIRFGARKILFKRCDLDAWLDRMRVDAGEARP